ncbi:site-specific integrase [Aquabacterium sp.]|uniref:site-specific integrase n=1 Tax=Aquabacterium sp. TaxID=1872578 RepID=UPI0035AF039B
MPTKRKLTSGSIQYIIKRAGVLEKPLYLTYRADQESEGDEHAARIEALLDKGIIPTEVQSTESIYTISQLVRAYERDAHPSQKDRSAIGPIVREHGRTPLSAINVDWVDAWISSMKRIDKLAPASIRARVGALARCTDWGVRKKHLLLPDNPLRNLPDGYAQYTKTDETEAGVKRTDVERDRRLEPGEHEKILATIEAGVLPRKQRPLVIEHKQAVRALYLLAIESAMRLREMYTLTISQVSLAQRTVFLEKTKNGDKRQVPLSSVAVQVLTEYIDHERKIPPGHQQDLLFPWWDGNVDKLGEVSDSLSKLFHNPRSPGVFDVAGCKDLKFHDLRHEATSRLFERTQLSEAQIMKVTGHKSHRMMMRYANLRGSNLADKLW